MTKQTYKIFAKFKYNNKEYFIILINNKKVLFCCLENTNIRIELTEEEKQLMNTVYQALRVDKKSSFYIGIENLDKKACKIFYDSKSKNYFWEPLNKNDEISEEEHSILNFKFNHMSSIIQNSEELEEYAELPEKKESKKEKFYNKILRIGRDFVIVLVASSIPLSVTYGFEQVPSQIKEFVIDSFKIDNYDFEDFRTAISENPNLTDSEKDFLYKFEIALNNDHEYMNLELIKSRLETVSFEYVKEECETNKDTAASYNQVLNKIIGYNTTSFEDFDKRDASHEVGHIFQEPFYSYLAELSNEAYSREIMRLMFHKGIMKESETFKANNDTYTNFGTGYQQSIFLYYILASMLPQETLKKYQFSADPLVLISALSKIENISFKEAAETVFSFNNIKKIDENGEAYLDEKGYIDCYNKLNNCFKKAKGIEVEEDFCMVMLYEDCYSPFHLYDSKQYISEARDVLLAEELYGIDPKFIDFYYFTKEINPEVLPKMYFFAGQSELTIHGKENAISVTEDLNEKYKKYMQKSKKELEAQEPKTDLEKE